MVEYAILFFVASLPHKPHWRYIIFSCEKSIILSLFKLYFHFGWAGTGRAITCFMSIFPLLYITTFPDKPVRQNNLFLFPPSWSSSGRKRFPAAWQPVPICFYLPVRALAFSTFRFRFQLGDLFVCLFQQIITVRFRCRKQLCQFIFSMARMILMIRSIPWSSSVLNLLIDVRDPPRSAQVGQHCLNEFTGRHASFHFVQMLFHICG